MADAPTTSGQYEHERRFWQLQNRSILWGAIPAATIIFGLDVIIRDGRWIIGPALIAASVLALWLADRAIMEAPAVPVSATRGQVIIAVLAVMTWIAVGYDIYD